MTPNTAIVLTLTAFTFANIILALLDAHKILKGKYILHGINAVLYAAMLLIPWLIFDNLYIILPLVFNRLLFFNIFLSLFRGLRWNYISPKPAAITDRAAKAIFGNKGTLMYGVYLILFILSIFISFNKHIL